MNQPADVMTVQWPSRYDLRWPARVTAGLLAAVAGLNLHGILTLAEGRPGRLLLQWMIVGAATGLSFLTWSARARTVTRPTGPFAARLDLAFQLVSLGAMTIVITVTRRARRAVGPVFPTSGPASSPAATPGIRGPRREGTAWAGVAIGGLAFSTLASVLAWDLPILNVPLAGLQPSVAVIVGTFHAGDDGTLIFTRDGRFVGTDLPYDLSSGGIRARIRWSGAGTWKIGTYGAQHDPGICLSPFAGNMSDGLTVGARSSPVLQIPVDPHYVGDLEFPHTTTLEYASYYELRKTR
jgi:hypothetical protein